jgi:hypothetical protein
MDLGGLKNIYFHFTFFELKGAKVAHFTRGVSLFGRNQLDNLNEGQLQLEQMLAKF